MVIVYLVYGLSFFILWTVLWAYHMKLGVFRLSQNLWLIGLFAISHGMSDWIGMLVGLQTLQDTAFQSIELGLLIASFLFLIAFGVRTTDLHRYGAWTLLIPFLLLVPVLLVIIFSRDRFLSGDIAARYLLGIPGGMMTFYALARQVPELRKINYAGFETNLKIAAYAFLFYTVFTGMIVPEAPFFPASFFNYRTFLSTTGIPVEIFRAVSVLAITYAMTRLLHAFEVEQTQSMKRVNEELEARVAARTAELTRSNEALRLRELEQKAILDNIPDMAWLKDRHSRFVMVNEPFARSAGAAPEELIAKSDRDVWPPGLAEQYVQDDREVIERRSRKVVEELVVDKEENPHWVETIKTPIYDDRGQVIGTTGISRDITERRKAVQLLKAEQSFRKAIEDSLSSGVAAIGLDGRQTYVNSAFCNMVGWSEQELLGAEAPFVYWPPEKVDVILDEFKRTLAGNNVSEAHEHTFVRRSGERFDVLLQTAPFMDGSGNRLGWVASVTDITGAKRVAEALRVSEQRYRAITENALDGIVTIDEQSRIVFANPAFARMLGYTAADLEGSSLTLLMPERFRKPHREAVRSYLSTGSRHIPWAAVQLPGLYKDGREIETEMSYGEFELSGRRYFTAVVRDITRRKEMENALRESEQLRQMIIDAVPAMIAYVGRDLRYRFVNHQYEEWFRRPAAAIVGRHISDLLGEDRFQEIERYTRSVLSGERVSYERGIAGPEQRELHIDYVPHLDASGETTGFFSLITDVTERKKSEERLQALNQKLSGVLNSITEAYYAFDSQWRILEMNREAEKILGPARDLVGKVYWELFPQAMGTQIDHEYRGAMREGRPVHFEARSNINRRWYEIHGYPRRGRLEVYFRDITERKRLEEIVQHRAYHDPLTDLPNRLLFEDILKVELAQARRNRKKLAVLYLDLDRFKEINDTLGHDAGDELLRQVGSRLRSSIRESDTVARIGGDEFTMVLSDVQEVEDLRTAVRKILTAFRNAFSVQQEELQVTASIGISIYPDDERDPASLLKTADRAMYFAKQAGKNRYRFYDRGMGAGTGGPDHREKHRLQEALERGEFTVHYHPEVDARTGTLVGAEALLRWQHPDRGLLLPAEFLPLAEETGIILPLGKWLILTVARQLKAWQLSGYRPIRVTINLSSRQFHQKELSAMTGEILAQEGVKPRWLEFEIPERVAMRDIDLTAPHLQALAKAGVGMSLDNFGTGRMPLSLLKKLPFRKLKIDRSLIRNILTDPSDRMVVEAMIVMSHKMQILAAAEGVERQGELDMLREQDCDTLQGFMIGRPQPAHEFERLLTRTGGEATS